jgi:ABC-type Fe2+-enterobactin transport system substrate-binding protein
MTGHTLVATYDDNGYQYVIARSGRFQGSHANAVKMIARLRRFKIR